ncbi:hypothetical protein V8D89_002953 [Ganoderma adspersum]
MLEILVSFSHHADHLKAILFYDWLLCLDQEVTCIWKAAGDLNAGSLVYALSRYPMIIGLVINTATVFPLSLSVSIVPHSCRFVVFAADSFTLLSGISTGTFSAFRVYAISGRKVIPTLVVSLLSNFQFIQALIMYSGFSAAEVLPSPFNCSSSVTLSSRFIFGVLASLNVLQIILTAVSVDDITGKESYVAFFIDPISSILTCRFILNLRQVDHSRMSSTMSTGEDVQFAAQGSKSTLPRFIATFGEPLHTVSARSEEGDEVEEVDDSGSPDGSSRMQGRVDGIC